MDIKRIVGAALGVAALIGMAACGTETTATSESNENTTTAAVTCQDVDLKAAQIVGTGGEPGDFTAIKAVAAKAPDRKNAWLMAIRFTPSDGGDPVDGVWLTSGVTETEVSPIMAVDGQAQQFSHWPSSINGEKLAITEPGAQQVKDCLAK